MRFVLRLQNYIFPLTILLLGVGLQLSQPYPVTFVRNLVFDQYNRWQPRLEQGSPVIFVDIDEASLRQIGQFPWPRNIFGELIAKMTAYGSSAIAFDILFAEPDRTAPSQILPVWKSLRVDQNADSWEALRASITAQVTHPDDAFARAMIDAPVVMPIVMSNEVGGLPTPKAGIAIRVQNQQEDDADFDPLHSLPNSTTAIANRPVLYENALGLGSINAHIDDDGIIRRASLLYKAGAHVFPSLSLESLRVAQGAGSIVVRASNVRGEGIYTSGLGLSRLKVGNIIAPIEPDGSMRLYYAPSASIERVSAYEILRPDFNGPQLAGKIAFIGTSAAGIKDIRATPLSQTTAGVEVHIQTVQQLISGTFLKRPIWVQLYEGGATLLLGTILTLMVQRFSIVPSLVFLLAAISAGAAISWYQFSIHFLLIDPATPSLNVFVAFLVAAFLHFLQTARERREVRNAFRYYLAPDMVAQIANNPSKLQLGGETRNLTVLFADIRGFTTISETFADAPAKLTHIINVFLTSMSQLIQARAGTIDKYIGDNIMAFWNAPIDVENHAYEACRATLEMKAALCQINQRLHQDPLLDGWHGEIDIGIGLNSGATLVGNIGSDQRFNYSVMGDTVNVSARLESQTKEYRLMILIGEATYLQAQATIEAGAKALAFLEVDLVALKGKALPQRIYALIGDADFAAQPAYHALVEAQADLLHAYRAQNWDGAQEQANHLRTTYPELAGFYQMLTARIESYRAAPPADDWNGQYNAPSK